MELFFQLPGEMGINQTIQLMRQLVNQNYLNPWIRERGVLLAATCQRDPICEDSEILNFVRSRVIYMSDPTDVEALHNPVSFMEQRLRENKAVWGDCDDMSVYIATLLKAIGHRPKFRIVGRKKQLHHVLVYCHINLDATLFSGDVPLDPTPGRIVDVMV